MYEWRSFFVSLAGLLLSIATPAVCAGIEKDGKHKTLESLAIDFEDLGDWGKIGMESIKGANRRK